MLDLARQHAAQPFSGVITLQVGGQPALEQSYGLAQRAEAVPNTPRTRFGMASGAKTFTAVAVGQLVDQGRLTFNTRLADSVSLDFPRLDPAITVHHLLTHTAGNPDYFDEEVLDDYEALWRAQPMYQFRTPRDFVPLFAEQPMKFAPGARWAYSNAGYILLGLIVEHVTGQRFADYVQAHVLAPCGMTDSGYFALDQLPERTAYGYIEAAGGWRTNFYALPVVGGPDGGAFTTAPDLARFWEALRGGRLLSAPTTKALFTPHATREPGSAEKYYGYGMWINRGAAGVEDFMLGEDPGVAFYSGYFDWLDAQLTILGNTGDATWPMLDRVRGVLRAAKPGN